MLTHEVLQEDPLVSFQADFDGFHRRFKHAKEMDIRYYVEQMPYTGALIIVDTTGRGIFEKCIYLPDGTSRRSANELASLLSGQLEVNKGYDVVGLGSLLAEKIGEFRADCYNRILFCCRRQTCFLIWNSTQPEQPEAAA